MPCGTCRADCEENSNNCICCIICEKRYHRKCQSLSKKQFDHFKTTDTYICSPHCFHYDLPFFERDDIDYKSAVFGDGKYPCKKCKRDCLEGMNCISCSCCGKWLHFECTKLTAEEFKTIPYFFLL